jgi:hypothetical protein
MCQPFAIINFARIPEEIKLRNVPMQVSSANVVESSVHAAFEKRESRFDRIAVRAIRVRVFAS